MSEEKKNIQAEPEKKELTDEVLDQVSGGCNVAGISTDEWNILNGKPGKGSETKG